MPVSPDEIVNILKKNELGERVVPHTVFSDNATYRDERKSIVIVAPEPCESENRYKEIILLVSLAKEYGFALHPISKGLNLGYGGANPYRRAIILDLSKFNRVIHFDLDSGQLTIEPGVSQDDVYKFLVRNGNTYINDTTGAPKESSIIGNYIERGFGHTPLAEHPKNILHCEVLIPFGKNRPPEIFCTATDGTLVHNSVTKIVRTYCIGADYTGIFIQNNLGVILNMTIKLLPKPEAFYPYFIPFSDAQAIDVLDICAKLRKQGTIHSAAHIGNSTKALQLLAVECPEMIENYDSVHLNKLIKTLRLDDWTLSGGFYGTKNQVKAHISDIKKAFKPLGLKVIILNRTLLNITKFLEGFVDNNRNQLKSCLKSNSKLLKRLSARLFMLPGLNALCDLKQGKPNNYFLRSVYWRNLHKVHQKEFDLTRDNVGLLWGAPCAPFNGDNFYSVYSVMKSKCEEFDLECPISVTLVNERNMECVLSLSFDRDDPKQEENALNCYKDIMTICTENHFPPYRMSTFSNEFLNYENIAFSVDVLNLKEELDPCNVISPGKYKLMSKNFTHEQALK